LVKTLAAAGVRQIFSLSGNQIMPIYDACLDAKIEIIHTRHEAAAVFMADAYAQLTGGIGVCLVTAAPGASNALGPLFTARKSESPVLFLTGDSARAQDGMGAFQELDQVSMSAPLTKLSFRAKEAKGLGQDMVRAIRTALSGRPGPVHVALPFDVLEADAKGADVPKAIARETAVLPAGDAGLVAKIIAEAKTPLVLTGPALNATRAGEIHVALSRELDAPVVAMESPRGLKDPALGEFARALARADVILCLGKTVNFTLGFGATSVCNRNTKWIVLDAEAVELDRAQLNLRDRLTFAATADPREAATALIEAGTGGTNRAQWRADVAALISARNDVPDTHPGEKITPAALCAAVQRQVASASSSVVISDGGEFGQWSQAGTAADYRLINGPSGAIGGAFCYGIAAKLAKPHATVFALMGDGTAGFHFAEFETAVRNNTPFVVVIGNDECWNAEHLIQLHEYGPDRLIGCKLSSARYDEAAKGFGAHGEYVTQLADLDAALERAVNSGVVACVNVQIEGAPAPSGF